MKQLILFSLSLMLSVSCLANVTNFSWDDQYIRLDLVPLCSADGQVTFTLTNTSGQKLFVDPHIANSELFDLARARMYLRNTDENKLVGLSPLTEYVRISDWSVLVAGGAITYPIDYTKHVTLDTSKAYRAGADIRMKILLENGNEIVVKIDSAVLNKYVDIQPSCFK
jgi:hypothetical protein